MLNELIIAGAWLVVALFFTFINQRATSSVTRFFTYWGLALSTVVSVVLLVRLSLEYLNGP